MSKILDIGRNNKKCENTKLSDDFKKYPDNKSEIKRINISFLKQDNKGI